MNPRQKLVLALIAVIPIVAAVALWITNNGSASQASDAIIEARIPAANEKVLAQAEVGVDLISGWEAELTLNGRLIPKDQVRAVPAQGRFTFVPGVGKEVEVYQGGQNCVQITYWQLANPNQTFADNWCFSVF